MDWEDYLGVSAVDMFSAILIASVCYKALRMTHVLSDC